MRLIILILLAASFAWPQAKKVVVQGLPPSGVARLQTAVGNRARVIAVQGNESLREIPDAEAFIGQNLTPEEFRAARQLKWIQLTIAGLERLLTPELRASSVVVTNARIIQGPEIADHAFALLLALTRGLNRTIPAKPKEEWGRDQVGRTELNGGTAVIIGVGGIGTQIAQRAKGFGMRVIGVDPKDLPLSMLVDRQVPPDRLDEVLPEADVIFVSAPLTAESQGMIGPRQFELMKKGAYFIAVSRGKLYSSDALVKALDSQHLAGAGLDVTDPEPLPKGHPLWKFENVVITPHIATQSDKLGARTMGLVEDNLKRFLAGEPLRNVVDKAKGY